MITEKFTDSINKIMQSALNLNVIDGMSAPQLISFVEHPENHIKSRIMISKAIIDKKNDNRKCEALLQSDQFKQLKKLVTQIKEISDWMSLLQNIQISRGEKGMSVSVPHPGIIN